MTADPLQPWSSLASLPRSPIAQGLINDTWRVGEPPRAVVQRLHPVFGPRVHEDIEAITSWLQQRGVPTPRLIPTDAGALWAVDPEDRCWRAMTWVRGRCHDRLSGPAMAREAGALVGRWHRATEALQHDFAFTRPGAHDTEEHLRKLRAAVDQLPRHRLYGDVARLAEEVQRRWAGWSGRLHGPPRIAHGDLKISNLMFDDQGRGLCLIDLDTMALLPLDVELGDAWRSWLNRAGEDCEQAALDVELFAASAGGYLAANPLPASEREALVPGIERIALELAARFAADALREAYFGWNPDVAPARGEHNLLRARGQLDLARQLRRQQGALEAALGL